MITNSVTLGRRGKLEEQRCEQYLCSRVSSKFEFHVTNSYLSTGDPHLMRISLLQISLLPFKEKFQKYLANRFFCQNISLLHIRQGLFVWLFSYPLDTILENELPHRVSVIQGVPPISYFSHKFSWFLTQKNEKFYFWFLMASIKAFSYFWSIAIAEFEFKMRIVYL